MYFKTREGSPFLLTKGQSDIFRLIHDPSIKRAAVKAVTQYGKSDIASMALILSAIERKEKILIVSPSLKQSSIIMSYVISHVFDDPDILATIEYEGSLERLKQERSKTRITYRAGGEIFILTAEAETVSREAKNLMGFGANKVIVDERPLIPDVMYSRILRMVGGVTDGKIVLLGNAFPDSQQFQKVFQKDSRYTSLTINWHQALAEGRITQEFIDEAKEEMSEIDFKIFYDAEFPSIGAENAVIPTDWIKNAINQEGCIGEHKQAGVDVARFGRDKTVYIFREGGMVRNITLTEKLDTMEVIGWVRPLIGKDKPDITAIDVIGIGSGVVDRLSELEYKVAGVNVGESPTDDENKKKYYNLRAQVHWNLRTLFKPDKKGKSQISIPDDKELVKELSEIRYSYSSERKIKIEPKEEMKKRLGKSPDKADALALAFHPVLEDEPQMVIA